MLGDFQQYKTVPETSHFAMLGQQRWSGAFISDVPSRWQRFSCSRNDAISAACLSWVVFLNHKCFNLKMFFNLERLQADIKTSYKIISSEIRCDDCHVMWNWNFLVHLSAASFTAALICCNASKSDCTASRAIRAIWAVRAIRAVGLRPWQTTGSQGPLISSAASWPERAAVGVVGLTLTPLQVPPNMSPIFARFGLTPSRCVQHGRHWTMSSTYHAKCV